MRLKKITFGSVLLLTAAAVVSIPFMTQPKPEVGFFVKVGKTDLDNYDGGQVDRDLFEHGVSDWYNSEIRPIVEEYGPGIDLCIWSPFGNWFGYNANGSFAYQAYLVAQDRAPWLTDDWTTVMAKAMSSGDIDELRLYIGSPADDVDDEVLRLSVQPMVELAANFPGRVGVWLDAGSKSTPNDRIHDALQYMKANGLEVGVEAIAPIGSTHLHDYEQVATARFFLGAPDGPARYDVDSGEWIVGDRVKKNLNFVENNVKRQGPDVGTDAFVVMAKELQSQGMRLWFGEFVWRKCDCYEELK